MADPQPQTTTTDELIRMILRSVDPTEAGNADEFGKVALAALEKVNREVGETANARLPEFSKTLADNVSDLATANQAIMAYRQSVLGMTDATQRFNAARGAHSATQHIAKTCDTFRNEASKIQAEISRQASLLATTRAAVGEFIVTGCGIAAAQTGAGPPAPDSYAGRLAVRISALQKAFTEAAVIQKTLHDRSKTVATGMDLLSEISTGLAAADVDFLQLMNPPVPAVPEAAQEQVAEPVEISPAPLDAERSVELARTPGPVESTPTGVPDAAELADIILGAQAKAAQPGPPTSTALMVIPQPK